MVSMMCRCAADPAALSQERPDRIFSNLDKVDSEICVFRRERER